MKGCRPSASSRCRFQTIGRTPFGAGARSAAAPEACARTRPAIRQCFETYLLFRPRVRRFPGLKHRNIKHPQPFAFQAGLILKKSEQERALSGLRRRVATIEVPQKGLAGCAGLRGFFRMPEGPN